MAVYRLSNDDPKERWMSAIRDSGLRNWNRCIILLNQARNLDLPKNLEDRLSKMLDYTGLRIDSYDYMYRQLQAGTDVNTIRISDSMTYYNTQINAALESLKQP